ncbi:WD40 repeat domain-containing protein [Tunicatimonas pelagia]|uniref:WD40 repeat domain-containing protein n=1 Tax=Tunicatimonas pelagia TaxID=931531 RepID=UPI002665221A|nr:hypothetical protein [Tunicatimonas pelagia]WKN45467.1 hypothetical protein P0M28_10910 [Tunicatimonas pelagia]
MNKLTTPLLSVLGLIVGFSTHAQDSYLNFQLRLEPVWSRVADVMGERGSVESVEFSPDGEYIVSGTKFDYSVVVWQTADGTKLWKQKAGAEIERVGWSYDSKYVAAASEDYLATVYDAQTGEVVREYEHTSGIDGLIWANRKSWLVTGEEQSADGKGMIRVFNAEEGKEIQAFNFGGTVNELFFSGDDAWLVAVGHNKVAVYGTDDWQLEWEVKPEVPTIFTSGMFSPDAKQVIAVGTEAAGTEREIRGNVFIWDWKEGKLVKRFNHTGKKIESIAWHPNGKYIAHAGHDPYIYVYRVAEVLKHRNDNIPIAHKVWAGDNAEYIDFNADGSFLCSAHQNGLIKLWVWMGEESDLNTRRHIEVIQEQKNKN